MKKMFFAFLALFLTFAVSSCSDDDGMSYQVSNVKIKLVYPADSKVQPSAGVEVKLKNVSAGSAFNQLTDEAGVAVFQVPQGLYEASASDKRVEGAAVIQYNGLNSAVTVGPSDSEAEIQLVASAGASVVIKELYVGGCPKDDGSGVFATDQYVTLYNNSTETLDLSDYALAMVNPFNAHGSNNDYVNGSLFYAQDGWIPAGVAVWYFQKEVLLKAGEQLVIAMSGAIDHTGTYSQSVNLANKDYYCFHDTEDFDNPKYYPSPFDGIPRKNYLKAYKYGLGNAWPLSQFSPAFFVFRPQGTDLKSFVEDPATTNNYNGNPNMGRKMVPVEWIVDGVEVFCKGKPDNKKRLLSSVDAGSVEFTRGLGYTVYRNVDKEATEAIAENEGKLVYNYSLGVEGSTDPSAIDAEASIKNGARIIYKDTNNSSADFHMRSKAALRN